jgi:cytochrome b pre-mRNA-processing protein 3
MLGVLKRHGERQAVVERLCTAVSDRSRAAVFFEDFHVADTIDGRFDLLTLHAWLVLDALRKRGDTELGQRFVDSLFVHFDEALRQLGAGDVGMSRRMKTMAAAFFGRLEAYRVAPDGAALAGAIARNLYRGAPLGLEPSRVLATYCSAARAALDQSRLETGEIDFGALPAIAG